MGIDVAVFSPEQRRALLDSAVWAERRLGIADDGTERVRLAFAPPDAVPEQPPVEGATLTTVWIALRSTPAGVPVVINEGGDSQVDISASQVEGLLGGSAAEASILSFRDRARWSDRWVLVHLGATDRLAGTIEGRDGRAALPVWTDEEEANRLAPEGARVGQTPLLELLAGGDEVDVLVDPGTSVQLYIDQRLREELLATSRLFPRGYDVQLGVLDPRANAAFYEAGTVAARDARASGRPFRGLWVIGYQLEDAPPKVLFVVDADDVDEAASFTARAMNRQERRTERAETVLLGDLPAAAQEYVRTSPDLAA